MAKYNKEIENIIIEFRTEIRKRDYEHNLLNTTTLCKCILESVFEIALSSLESLSNNRVLPTRILARSIIEYATDINYLSIKDSIEVNKLYKNYYILLIFWYKNRFEAKEVVERIPEIEQRFNDYLPEIYKSLNFKDKGKEYDKEGLIAPYSVIINSAKNKFRSHWSGLDFTSRSIEIRNALSNEKEIITYDRIEDFYSICSNYVHSNVYGGIPDFSPITEDFRLEYKENPKTIELAEESVYFAIDFAITGFIRSLTKDDRKQYQDTYVALETKSANISNWFINE